MGWRELVRHRQHEHLLVLAVAATLALLPVLQRFVLLPLYLEHPQHWLSLLNRISGIIAFPGKILTYRVMPPRGHVYSDVQVLVTAGFSLVIYFLLLSVFLNALVFRHRRRRQAAAEFESVDTPPAPDRREFLRRSGVAAAGLAGAALCSYPVLITPGRIGIRREQVAIKGLPAELSGLTIAQLTDLHHDEWISARHIRRGVDMANDLKPDLVALTGDYVTSHVDFIDSVLRELERLAPRVGVVSCLGNHDWWADAPRIHRGLEQMGYHVLNNDRVILTADRRLEKNAAGGLCIAGVGDLWEDVVDLPRALDGVAAETPRLLLSHNPDVAEDAEIATGAHRVDLMLCGHTHGGQVRLPGMRAPILPSAYGSKYAQGLVEGPGCPVQISAGIGLALLPVRVNVDPEIVLITLVSA